MLTLDGFAELAGGFLRLLLFCRYEKGANGVHSKESSTLFNAQMVLTQFRGLSPIRGAFLFYVKF